MKEMRFFTTLAIVTFLAIFTVPSFAGVESITTNVTLKNRAGRAIKNSPESFVYVREGGRLFTLASPKAVHIITDEDVIRLTENGRPEIVNHNADPLMTELRALKLQGYPSLKNSVTDRNIISLQRNVGTDIKKYDAIIQVGKKKWGIKGKSVRFFVAANGEVTLGNYPIHYADLPQLFADLTETGVVDWSPYFVHGALDRAHQVLAFAEFFRILYPERRFEKGEFKREAEYLRISRPHTVRDGKRVVVTTAQHLILNSLARGIVGTNALRYHRSGEVDFREVYYAHLYCKYTTSEWWYPQRSNLTTDEQVQKFLSVWERMADHQIKRRMTWAHVSRKYVSMYEAGRDLPLAPPLNGEDRFAELEYWPKDFVYPQVGSQITTWGNIKRR